MSPRRQTKYNIDVGNTPEYVNAHRLKDFHKQHAENYRNDFNCNEEYASQTCTLGGVAQSPTQQSGILRNGYS